MIRLGFQVGTRNYRIALVLEPGNILAIKKGLPIRVNLKELCPELDMELEVMIDYTPDADWMEKEFKQRGMKDTRDFSQVLKESMSRPENCAPAQAANGETKLTPPRCFYPNCVLEEHETGEHKFGRPEKPWGELRYINAFNYSHTRCESCPLFLGQPMHSAIGFFSDMLGFGWALCAECAREFTAKVAEVAKEEPETHLARKEEKPGQPLVTANSSASFASSAVKSGSPTKVLKFEPRANSQKLKAGVS